MDLSRRLKTAAHETGLEIRYNSFFTLTKILSYSLNIYKTKPQNSITLFLSFPSKKKSQKGAALEHSNSGHPFNFISYARLCDSLKIHEFIFVEDRR